MCVCVCVYIYIYIQGNANKDILDINLNYISIYTYKKTHSEVIVFKCSFPIKRKKP